MKLLRIVSFVCLIAMMVVAANASDLNFGSTARSIALGGAGLALGDNSGTTSLLNPAAPAASGAKFGIMWPSLDMHSKGASFNDLTSSISKISDGSTESALELVNDFAKHDTTLSVNSALGFTGPIGIAAEGEASGLISPGPAAQSWANAALSFENGAFNPVDFAAQLNNTNVNNAVSNWLLGNRAAAETAFNKYLAEDLSVNSVTANVVYALPAVTLSRGFSTKTGGKLYLGTDMKLLHGESQSWDIVGKANSYSYNDSNVPTANLGFDAVEQPIMKSTSFKADVGAIYKPANSIWQYGAVIDNFIKPNLTGITNGMQDPMFSIGVAAVPVKGMIFAADLVNLTGTNGEKAELRMGSEWRLGSLMTARAGFAGNQFTYGVQVLGMDFAFAGKSVQLLSNVLKF